MMLRVRTDLAEHPPADRIAACLGFWAKRWRRKETEGKSGNGEPGVLHPFVRGTPQE